MRGHLPGWAHLSPCNTWPTDVCAEQRFVVVSTFLVWLQVHARMDTDTLPLNFQTQEKGVEFVRYSRVEVWCSGSTLAHSTRGMWQWPENHLHGLSTLTWTLNVLDHWRLVSHFSEWTDILPYAHCFATVLNAFKGSSQYHSEMRYNFLWTLLCNALWMHILIYKGCLKASSYGHGKSLRIRYMHA